MEKIRSKNNAWIIKFRARMQNNLRDGNVNYCRIRYVRDESNRKTEERRTLYRLEEVRERYARFSTGKKGRFCECFPYDVIRDTMTETR